MASVKKIVLTGPESTGKSELCQALAAYFTCTWIPEYARIYLEENGSNYNFELLLTIAQQHKAFQQKQLLAANNLVFLDTDLINYKVWSDLVFGKVHPWIKQTLQTETDHFYLLTSPDLPWKADPLRENPTNRSTIFDLHLAEIKKKNMPYKVVSGLGENRIQNAIESVKSWQLL